MNFKFFLSKNCFSYSPGIPEKKNGDGDEDDQRGSPGIPVPGDPVRITIPYSFISIFYHTIIILSKNFPYLFKPAHTHTHSQDNFNLIDGNNNDDIKSMLLKKKICLPLSLSLSPFKWKWSRSLRRQEQHGEWNKALKMRWWLVGGKENGINNSTWCKQTFSISLFKRRWKENEEANILNNSHSFMISSFYSLSIICDMCCVCVCMFIFIYTPNVSKKKSLKRK